ncbi:MAG: DoxX family membrane protein [Phycisphaerales bacterium]|nr:DoxX family membrane protein [Phycisphaerales bacterium]
MKAFERTILLLVRLGVATLFGYAGYLKLEDPARFKNSVRTFNVIDRAHVGIVTTYAIPWLELVCAACLLLGLWTRAAAALLSMLLVVFITLIVKAAIIDGRSITCGCFGKFNLLCTQPLGWCHVGQDAVLLAMSLLLVWRRGGFLQVTPDTLKPVPASTSTPTDRATA